jgi:cytochrome c biogenesis protein
MPDWQEFPLQNAANDRDLVQASPAKRRRPVWTTFSSVKATVILLSLTACTILIGAWCPQEAQVGRDKVLEQFGNSLGPVLIELGVSDIFHTPYFLTLIGMLFISLTIASWQKVFPRLLTLRKSLPFLNAQSIGRLPGSVTTIAAGSPDAICNYLTSSLVRKGYNVRIQGTSFVAESGKIGRLAPTITHIGLLTLLTGVTITSWSGFAGFKPVLVGSNMNLADSEHSKLWVGSLPNWHVHVDSTRRENYQNGDAKQWYTKLTVIDNFGKELTTEEISVNNPLSYDGIDIYQSSWALDQLQVLFNGEMKRLQLRPMGKIYVAFFPLSDDETLILSVRDQDNPLRVFAKSPRWRAPKLLGEVPPGQSLQIGAVNLQFFGVIPMTGLQYKSDPGLVATYVAFAFITVGVLLASISHRTIWGIAEGNEHGETTVTFGGNAKKGKISFAKELDKLNTELKVRFLTGSSSLPRTEAITKSGKTNV